MVLAFGSIPTVGAIVQQCTVLIFDIMELTKESLFAKVKANAVISIESEVEPMSYEDEFDEDGIKAVEQAIENNYQWGWCSVHVTAKYSGLVGEDWLGGCSYKSEQDFIDNSGYYQDMMDTALQDLVNQIWEVLEQLEIVSSI